MEVSNSFENLSNVHFSFLLKGAEASLQEVQQEIAEKMKEIEKLQKELSLLRIRKGEVEEELFPIQQEAERRVLC